MPGFKATERRLPGAADSTSRMPWEFPIQVLQVQEPAVKPAEQHNPEESALSPAQETSSTARGSAANPDASARSIWDWQIPAGVSTVFRNALATTGSLETLPEPSSSAGGAPVDTKSAAAPSIWDWHIPAGMSTLLTNALATGSLEPAQEASGSAGGTPVGTDAGTQGIWDWQLPAGLSDLSPKPPTASP